MSEFLLLFRNDPKTAYARQQPGDLEAGAKLWQDWIQSVVRDNKFVSSGSRMSSGGRVVRSNRMVTDGPYAEIKETLAGMMTIRAKDYEDAIEIAKGCPIIRFGGSVEVRQLIDPHAPPEA